MGLGFFFRKKMTVHLDKPTAMSITCRSVKTPWMAVTMTALPLWSAFKGCLKAEIPFIISNNPVTAPTNSVGS